MRRLGRHCIRRGYRQGTRQVYHAWSHLDFGKLEQDLKERLHNGISIIRGAGSNTQYGVFRWWKYYIQIHHCLPIDIHAARDFLSFPIRRLDPPKPWRQRVIANYEKMNPFLEDSACTKIKDMRSCCPRGLILPLCDILCGDFPQSTNANFIPGTSNTEFSCFGHGTANNTCHGMS